ncbi:MAG: recombinase family protein [Brevundimonas sp.]
MIEMQPTFAIPYHRFSDNKQERGSSLERQREITAAVIAAEGWTAMQPQEDRGESAWKGHHLDAALGEITRKAKAGEYPDGTVIVAERMDRLSRQGNDTFKLWMREIIGAGLLVYTCDDRTLYDQASLDNDTLGQKVTFLVKAEAARDYVTNLRRITMHGTHKRQAKSAELGRPTCLKKERFDNVPGFFGWVGDTLEIDERRADMVRDMYRWSADGMGANSIAKRLNNEGRLAWGHGKDKAWQPSSIYKLLLSPSVEGDFIPTHDGQPGERIVGYYFGLRIVDADLVQEARQAAASRAKAKGSGPSADFVNIFQGVARCGGCYGRLHVQKCRDGSGVVRRYFRCSAASRNAGCSWKGMHPYEIFEDRMLDQMLHLAMDDRFFARPDNVRPLVLEVAELEKLLADTKAKARRIGDRINGQDDPPALWLEQEAGYLKIIATTESRLESARKALEDARGTVSPEAHLQRVLEVREAMRGEDRAVAMVAARKVKDAVRGVVDVITSDRGPAGEKSMLVFMAGTLITFRVSNDDGTVTNYQDRIALALRGQPGLPLFKRAVSIIDDDGVTRLSDIVRRKSAA